MAASTPYKRKIAARKAAQTKLNIKYQKEQMRLLDFQHQLELSGYRFTGSVLPATPKKITAGSVRKLQKITPEYILKNATFLDDETGRVVGGLTQYKKEPPVLLAPPVTKVGKPKRKKGTKPKKRKKKQTQKKPYTIDRTDLTLNNFKYILKDLGETRPEELKYLTKLLDEQIQQYGAAAIAQQLANIPPDELKEVTNTVNLYGGSHPTGGVAMQKLYSWITGTIPSFEEVKTMGGVNAADDYEDNDEWDE